MSNRNIKLVLPAFLYSLLLFSNILYAMDPPTVDAQESSQDESDSHKNLDPICQLLQENEFLHPSEALLVRDIIDSPEYKKIVGGLGYNLHKNKHIVPNVIFIGYHLPGGMEELLVVLVGVARIKELMPTIEKVIAHFVPENFPDGKRSELADKLLYFLDRLCSEHPKSEMPREKSLLKDYGPIAIAENITMKGQALLHEVTEDAMSRWMKGERKDNAVSNFNKFSDDIKHFFMLEFLQKQDESERIHFMDVLFEIIQNFFILNNIDAASVTIMAFRNITRLAGIPTKHLEEVNGFYKNKIMQPNPICLNFFPRFSVITNKYDVAYGLIKENSPYAFSELCTASRQLSDTKKRCAYSFELDPNFDYFFDAIDVTESAVENLYGCIFTSNNDRTISGKEYVKWSTADMVSFFKSHDRMDLLRGLLQLRIIDGATLYQKLSGDNDESKNLYSLLKPLLVSLLKGELGSMKEGQIDTNKNTPPTSPTKMKKSPSKGYSKARISSNRSTSPNSPLPTTDVPARAAPTRKKSSVSLKRLSHTSSSGSGSSSVSRRSESSEADTKSGSPEKRDSQEGLMKITKEPAPVKFGSVVRKLSYSNLATLEQVELELPMKLKPKTSQDP